MLETRIESLHVKLNVLIRELTTKQLLVDHMGNLGPGAIQLIEDVMAMYPQAIFVGDVTLEMLDAVSDGHKMAKRRILNWQDRILNPKKKKG